MDPLPHRGAQYKLGFCSTSIIDCMVFVTPTLFAFAAITNRQMVDGEEIMLPRSAMPLYRFMIGPSQLSAIRIKATFVCVGKVSKNPQTTKFWMPLHMEDCHRNLDVVAPLSPGALVLATHVVALPLPFNYQMVGGSKIECHQTYKYICMHWQSQP